MGLPGLPSRFLWGRGDRGWRGLHAYEIVKEPPSWLPVTVTRGELIRAGFP